MSVPNLFVQKLLSFRKCRCIFPLNAIGLVLCLIIEVQVWFVFFFLQDILPAVFEIGFEISTVLKVALFLWN